MLYKFKSKNTADVIMLEPHGRFILDAIGKGPGKKGILLPEEMPAAIKALQTAIAKEEAQIQAQAQAQAQAQDSTQEAQEIDPEMVGLRQRLTPFIEMLRLNRQTGDPVVWGV